MYLFLKKFASVVGTDHHPREGSVRHDRDEKGPPSGDEEDPGSGTLDGSVGTLPVGTRTPLLHYSASLQLRFRSIHRPLCPGSLYSGLTTSILHTRGGRGRGSVFPFSVCLLLSFVNLWGFPRTTSRPRGAGGTRPSWSSGRGTRFGGNG